MAGDILATESFRRELFGLLVDGVGSPDNRADGGASCYARMAEDRDQNGSLMVAQLPYSEATGLPPRRPGDLLHWADEMKVAELERISYLGNLVTGGEYPHLSIPIGLTVVRILRDPEITAITKGTVGDTIWFWKNH